MRIYEAERELKCQACKNEYPVWFTDNDTWNEICDNNDMQFLCPTCFAMLARGQKAIWKLTLNKE